ncbi:hypothetical protein CsNV_030 [Callinectes sapidus nudivirus]|nr:hypothetical protein CsNV_030 [Callinectes sapidus nudivirus]
MKLFIVTLIAYQALLSFDPTSAVNHDCYINNKSEDIKLQNFPVVVVSYLEPTNSITFKFNEIDSEFNNTLKLTNSAVIETKLIEQPDLNPFIGTHIVHLSHMFPEGWNRMTISIDETNNTMNIKQIHADCQGNIHPELVRSIKYKESITSVTIEGTYSFCNQPIPKWKLFNDETVKIKMHPMAMKQTLINDGPGNITVLMEDAKKKFTIYDDSKLVLLARWGERSRIVTPCKRRNKLYVESEELKPTITVQSEGTTEISLMEIEKCENW